ncbi:MAG: hypothetical protein V2A73_19525 [Pseudomonadota bacterium]
MRVNPKGRLFFGCKVDSKLREALAQATAGDRHYFEDPSSTYLRVISLGEDQWIGKVVDGGIAPAEVDDIQRNVLSILNRIAPGARHSSSAMRVYCVDEVLVGPQDP